MTASSEDFGDLSVEECRALLKKREGEKKTFNDKADALKSKIDSIDTSVGKLVPELERDLSRLKSVEEKSRILKSELCQRNSMTLCDMVRMENELLVLDDLLTSVCKGRDGARVANPNCGSSKAVPEKTAPKFHPVQYIPVGDSVLVNYEIFRPLSDEKQRRAYESLLKFRMMKISILEKIKRGVLDLLKIADEMDMDATVVQRNLEMLANFGEVSVDRRELSENADYAISLYAQIKRNARQSPQYAALAIYPMLIFKEELKSVANIKRCTDLKESEIVSGAEVLEKGKLITVGKVGFKFAYSGYTNESKELFLAIQNTYKKASSI